MRLTSTELVSLLDEVSAMVSAERPIAAGLLELGDRSLGRLGRVARRVSARLESGESPESAFASVSGKSSGKVAAAFRAMDTLGTAAPIRCVARSIQNQDATRTRLIIALIYPGITLLVAYLILAFVAPWIITTIQSSEYTIQMPYPRLLDMFQWLRANFWLPPLVLAVVGLVLVLVLRPTLGWFGRAAADQRWALFCDLLAIEVDADTETNRAIANAAEAVGNASFRDQVVAQVQALPSTSDSVGELPTSKSLPPLLRWSLSRMVRGQGRDHGLELRCLADLYRSQSLYRSRFWIQWLPVLVTVCMMTIVIAILVITLLGPLYFMIR